MMATTLSTKDNRRRHCFPCLIILILHAHFIQLYETRMFWVGPMENETDTNSTDIKVGLIKYRQIYIFTRVF